MGPNSGLTLLPDTDALRAVLGAAIAPPGMPPTTIAALFLDLDGLKAINHAQVHGTGDAVLRIVAWQLLGGIPTRTLAIRVDGDECACLLTGVASREQVSRLIGHLFDALARPLQIGSLILRVRPSIGVAMYPEDGDTPEALLQRADAGMYRAKRQRSGHSFFDAQDARRHTHPSGELIA